jgi:hypothetical protein
MEQLMRTWVAQNSANNYGCEELFLGTVIYSLLHNSMLVHSRYRIFQEESLSPFRSPIVNGDFIGQTHNFDANGNVTLQYPENV